MPGPARATSSIRVSSAVFAFIYKKAAQASDDGSHLRAHGRRTRALSRTHPAWLFVLCWRGSTEPSWRLDGPSRCPSRLSLVLPPFILGQTIVTYIAYHNVPFWPTIAHALLGLQWSNRACCL